MEAERHAMTPHAIFVLTISGTALAGPFTSTGLLAQRDPLEPRGGMGVATATFDVSGLESWDERGDTDNAVLTRFLAPDARVIGIGFDVGITTNNFSFFSDVNLGFENSDQSAGAFQTPAAGDDTFGTGAFSSGGIVDLTALAIPADFSLNPDGMIRIEIYESFDDVIDGVDATFGSGSTLRVRYTFVPTPGASAVLAFASLGALRRRRLA